MNFTARCLNTFFAHCSFAKLDHGLRLLVERFLFPQGWFVGFCPEWLWMWAATLLNDQIRRTVLRNRKPWHLFNVQSLLFYIQFLNPITILLYTIKIYLYSKYIAFFNLICCWCLSAYKKNVWVRNFHQHSTPIKRHFAFTKKCWASHLLTHFMMVHFYIGNPEVSLLTIDLRLQLPPLQECSGFL